VCFVCATFRCDPWSWPNSKRWSALYTDDGILEGSQMQVRTAHIRLRTCQHSAQCHNTSWSTARHGCCHWHACQPTAVHGPRCCCFWLVGRNLARVWAHVCPCLALESSMTGHGTRSCSHYKVTWAPVRQGQSKSCSMCLQCGSLWMVAAAPLELPTSTVSRASD
jgi:hypothetical protein